MTVHTINVGTENVINPESITVSVGDTVTFENTGTFHVTVDLPNDLFGDKPHLVLAPGTSDSETVSSQAAIGDNEFDVVWTTEAPAGTLGDGLGDGRKTGNIRVND